MTEDDARTALLANVPRETFERLEAFAAFLTNQAAIHNLVSASTLPILWSRHILDSAQLLHLAPPDGLWVDLGSGAGLPGMVIAALTNRSVILVEPRTKRASFLTEAARRMGIEDRVTIVCSRAETSPPAPAAVISARALAALSRIFAMGQQFVTPSTVWLLPKGRGAAGEVAEAERSWHGRMTLVPSITDSGASIIVATAIAPRKRA